MELKGITIFQDNNAILRKVSAPVNNAGGIDIKMIEMMKALQIPRRVYGLAAVQIGCPIRVIMFWYGSAYEFLVNPVIVKMSDKKCLLRESCLSIGEGNLSYEVARAKIVKVKGLTLNGKPWSRKAHGILARVLQHEINHLDGRLISDYLEQKKYRCGRCGWTGNENQIKLNVKSGETIPAWAETCPMCDYKVKPAE